MSDRSPMVYIRREWNDWHLATVRLDRLHDLHWDDSGGQVCLYGYVWCHDVEGDIGHSCQLEDAPHQIEVCVIEKDNDPEVYKQLVAQVRLEP
jgi:hypothetical protein